MGPLLPLPSRGLSQGSVHVECDTALPAVSVHVHHGDSKDHGLAGKACTAFLFYAYVWSWALKLLSCVFFLFTLSLVPHPIPAVRRPSGSCHELLCLCSLVQVSQLNLDLSLGLWAPSPHHCFSFQEEKKKITEGEGVPVRLSDSPGGAAKSQLPVLNNRSKHSGF